MIKETKGKKISVLRFGKREIILNLTLQNVVIIILLICYLIVFYAYKHDIDQYRNLIEQYQEIIEDPQKLCYIYYENLMGNSQQKSTINETKKNLSEIIGDRFILE